LPTIHFDCSEGKHKEANEMYSRSRNYCWGWSKTHTYVFSEPVIVTRIVGEINTGPSEYSTFFPVAVELSKNGTDWIKVGETGAKGREGYVPFDISVNNVEAKYLRFRALQGFVDGSKGDVYYEAPAPPTPPPTPPEQPPTPPEQPPAPPAPPTPPISKEKIGLIVAGLFVAGIIIYSIMKRRR